MAYSVPVPTGFRLAVRRRLPDGSPPARIGTSPPATMVVLVCSWTTPAAAYWDNQDKARSHSTAQGAGQTTSRPTASAVLRTSMIAVGVLNWASSLAHSWPPRGNARRLAGPRITGDGGGVEHPKPPEHHTVAAHQRGSKGFEHRVHRVPRGGRIPSRRLRRPVDEVGLHHAGSIVRDARSGAVRVPT